MRFLLLLFFSVIFSISSVANGMGLRDQRNIGTTMIVEGRTWWYKSERRIVNETQSFGITIGDTISYDDKTWNKVDLIAYSTPHSPDSSFSVVKERTTLGLIRESDNQISILRPQISDGYVPASLSNYLLYAYQNQPFSLYNFGNIGDSAYYGDSTNHYPYYIKDICDYENSNHKYQLFGCRFGDIKDSYFSPLKNEAYEFLDGIGHPRNLFICPFTGVTTDIAGWNPPQLTYVTEGEENTIIFKGVEDDKLWETSSVISIPTENNVSPSKWYNLQGLPVPYPQKAGIYIHRQDDKIQKVIIK